MTASLTDDRNEPLKKALTHGLAFWAIAAPLWVLVNSAFGGRFALDFHHAYLPAAHAVLHGASPYSGSSSAVTAGEAFVYPPVSAFLLVPFTLLPLHAAELLATVLVAASVPATLLVLGVRDWRCHAIAFLWWPTIIAIQSANVTLLLLLGVALAWRFRDRPLVVAIATGLVVAVKPFFWPLLLWLAATRRYRSLALASVVSFVLVVVPWAGIGFAGLHGYPHLLTSVSRVDGARSYSVAALLHLVASTSWTVATTTETVIGAGLVLLVIAAGRRGRDRDAIALAVVAILALMPLLEMQYLTTLLVVAGLYHRRLDAAWAAPLLIWGAAANGPGGLAIQCVHVLLVVAATAILAMTDLRPRALRWTPKPGAA